MRRFLRLFLVLFVIPTLLGAVVLVVAGRSFVLELLHQGTTYKFGEVSWISTGDLARWLDDRARPHPVVLDARSEAEFAVSHLQGARRMDPYRPSLEPLARAPKDTAVVVYSSAGYRGARVASWLQQQGYTKVRNLTSLFQWANDGRPVHRRDGPARVVHPYDELWGWLLEREYRARAPAVEKQSVAP